MFEIHDLKEYKTRSKNLKPGIQNPEFRNERISEQKNGEPAQQVPQVA
jgi:hypothetical protein